VTCRRWIALAAGEALPPQAALGSMTASAATKTPAQRITP
jgi:hypothetical protein